MKNDSTQDVVNPQTDNLPDSWETRLQQVSSYIGLSVEEIEAILSEYGVEKEPHGIEMLADEEATPFGDIRKEFCEKNGVKLPKLRIAMKFLRGPKESKKAYSDVVDPEMVELKEKFGIKMKIDNVDPVDLLPYYHPEKSNHPITTALKKRFGNKPIIVYKPDSKVVDIEETANYIADLEQGYPEQETVDVDGILVRIYPVGVVPNKMIEEDPFYPNSPLKRGRSIINRVNWSSKSKSVRQFSRIAVEMEEVDPTSKSDVRQYMKDSTGVLLNGASIPEKLQEIFPEVYLEYRERRERDELPKLTITIDQASGKLNNPFGVNKNRSW